MNMIIRGILSVFVLLVLSIPGAPIGTIQLSAVATSASPSCATGALNTFAASPGAWTAAYSLRKLLAAYAGSAVTLQRSSDSTTLNVGFNGCDPDTTASTAFCGTQTLAAGTTSSARAAFPSGSVIHVVNMGPSPVFYAAGNGSVTASTSSTYLMFRQGVNITVGANTNLAAIIGTGYGLDGGLGSATVFMTNCGVSAMFDQSGNANDLAPISAGLANQMAYVPSCQGSFPCLVGCLSSCGLKAADSASYKTATVETFLVMSFGEDITTAGLNYNSAGYPSTTSSSAAAMRWGLSNNGNPDLLTNNINASNLANGEGFGGLWRGQNLTQFDYSSGGITRWNGGTQFLNTGGGTPTYPNAVGLYVMGDAAGNGTPGMFVECLVASGTQTSRDSISANQVSYWGIATGTALTSALTNPLSDGWNWNQVQVGSFAPIGSNFTVNGNSFASEASWNNYTQWQSTNGLSTGGRLGDLWRFQISGLADQWDGTNRSEIDGAMHAQFNDGTTYWVAYAVLIEPGTAYTSSWNINGQMHGTGGQVCCVFNIMSNSNSVTDTWFVFTYDTTDGTPGAHTSVTTGVPITRNRYYHFVFQVNVSASGTNDTFNAWLDSVTPGTMVQIAAHSGASLFGGSSQSAASYWKYGVYRETGANKPTFAIRYGNMQVCSAGADCTTKYGVSDLSALTTTPLADPSHM